MLTFTRAVQQLSITGLGEIFSAEGTCSVGDSKWRAAKARDALVVVGS